MHHVLSYDTTVRTGNAPEQRKYVAKRTCVTLILTIAFFTLISGYLLGNFITERKYHVKQLLSRNDLTNSGKTSPPSVEFTSKDYISLKELHSYQEKKEKLLSSADVLNRMLSQDESYLASSLNTEIFNKYVSCTQDIPPTTNIETSRFIEELVENTSVRQKDCLRIIQVIIDNNLANG